MVVAKEKFTLARHYIYRHMESISYDNIGVVLMKAERL